MLNEQIENMDDVKMQTNEELEEKKENIKQQL